MFKLEISKIKFQLKWSVQSTGHNYLFQMLNVTQYTGYERILIK